MVKSFAELPASLDRFSRRIVASSTFVARDVAKAMGATVVDTTRVDTGKARSNWLATLNVPFSGTIPAYAPGNKLGIGETANASAAKSQQNAVISKFNARSNIAIFITNNTDYIETLNNGNSFIAPGNMIEQAVQVGRVVFKQSVKARVRRFNTALGN